MLTWDQPVSSLMLLNKVVYDSHHFLLLWVFLFSAGHEVLTANIRTVFPEVFNLMFLFICAESWVLFWAVWQRNDFLSASCPSRRAAHVGLDCKQSWRLSLAELKLELVSAWCTFPPAHWNRKKPVPPWNWSEEPSEHVFTTRLRMFLFWSEPSC